MLFVDLVNTIGVKLQLDFLRPLHLNVSKVGPMVPRSTRCEYFFRIPEQDEKNQRGIKMNNLWMTSSGKTMKTWQNKSTRCAEFPDVFLDRIFFSMLYSDWKSTRPFPHSIASSPQSVQDDPRMATPMQVPRRGPKTPKTLNIVYFCFTFSLRLLHHGTLSCLWLP